MISEWAIIGAIIYLLVTGIAGRYVSTQKGRNAWEGFFFGFFFGPIGLVVAAGMPDGQATAGVVDHHQRAAMDDQTEADKVRDAAWAARQKALRAARG